MPSRPRAQPHSSPGAIFPGGIAGAVPPFPCKNAPDVNSASRVLYRVGGAGEGWLCPPQPRPLPLYIYFSGFPSFWPFSVYKLVRTARATKRDLCPVCSPLVNIGGLGKGDRATGLGTAGTLDVGKNGMAELGRVGVLELRTARTPGKGRGGGLELGTNRTLELGQPELGTVRAGDRSW